MKRARVTTRSEAARARARPCPVPLDALLTLLDDAGVTVGQMCASTSVLTSLTADLVARNNEWMQQALAQVASFRSALLAHKTRVLASAKQLLRKQRKRFLADFEAADVSTEQLRVWAAVATGAVLSSDVGCALAVFPLLASPRVSQFPAVGVSDVIALPFDCELGSVATGDGLRVVSAAGPGLKWFEPHARNEFRVVFTHADGSVPVWLTTGDVAVALLSPVGTPSADGSVLRAAAVVPSEWERQGTVSVVYGGLSEDAPEAVLQLSVSGIRVADAVGDSDWCVRVPRRPVADHECAALGTHVRTLVVVEGFKLGMAVSTDEKWLVVGLTFAGMLSVYSLPGGELERTFGGEGDGPLQFNGLRRLCFAPNGNLIVVDRSNKRLQEVTLEGVFVRFVGVGEFGDGYPFCVSVHDDVIAVGCFLGTGPRVVLLNFDTGTVTSRFGELGTAPDQLSPYCSGIRFTHDGSYRYVIVGENEAKFLSLFTAAGVYVRRVGVGVLGGGCKDVLLSVTGDYVVTDNNSSRVCVFSPDGSELVRSWGERGTGDGQFEYPTALAAAGRHLYVMDANSGRVHVFE